MSDLFVKEFPTLFDDITKFVGEKTVLKRIVGNETCRDREIGSALVGLFFAGGDCFRVHS